MYGIARRCKLGIPPAGSVRGRCSTQMMSADSRQHLASLFHFYKTTCLLWCRVKQRQQELDRKVGCFQPERPAIQPRLGRPSLEGVPYRPCVLRSARSASECCAGRDRVAQQRRCDSSCNAGLDLLQLVRYLHNSQCTPIVCVHQCHPRGLKKLTSPRFVVGQHCLEERMQADSLLKARPSARPALSASAACQQCLPACRVS
jgi:hypothetical protein